MIRIKLLAFVTLAAVFFTSCDKVVGEGPVTTTDRTVAQFSAIDMSVPADIYYYTGTAYKVQIEAQQNITDLIESNVSGSTLQIHFNRNNVNIKSAGVRINVTSPGVNSIRISGSGNLYAPVPIEADQFELSLSGSCGAEIDSLIANSFAGSISGSGHIKVQQGSAHDIEVEISGSGNVDILGVTAANVNTHTSGSGTIKVTATEKLNAQISGSGRVYYKGSPDINADISGSGGVSKIE
jgi:hypothetical protein